MPVTRSAKSRHSRPSISQPKRRKAPKPRGRAVPSKLPVSDVGSEEHSRGDVLNASEQPIAPSSAQQQNTIPSPPTSNAEEDFGLQPLMTVANSNAGGDSPTPDASHGNSSSAQSNTVDGNSVDHRSDGNAGSGGNNSGPVQTLTKVPRPFGTAGRHFNLQREMGLESDRGLYNQIQRETRWAFNQANLPLLPFKRQDSQAIFAITQAMKERFPYLGRFVRPAVWPVIEMIKMQLRNRRAYHKLMGIALPEANGNGGMAVPN